MKILQYSKLVVAPILLVILMSFKTTAPDPQKITWLTWEEAMVKLESGEKKKIFIDVYTDWCGWCKKMDATTFSNPAVAKTMNEHFYAVKLDGEAKRDITFKGNTFKYVPSGRKGYHELAAALLQNKLSYPTVVFLDEEANMIQPLPGYREAAEFHKILSFIGEGHYKNGDWTAYQKSYAAPEGLK
jgi:thioredoxin-related protein